MASSLAAQLAQIATKSKISLDVKAQRAAHSKSLIFEPRVAAGQSFQSVFTICRDGFDELCQLDERFAPFGDTLFSEFSQEEDRTQMTEEENAALDKKIVSFLRLCGGKLRLMPAVKSIEWLIRRFRIHEFNTSTVITTFLPYHNIPAFVTLMSILPTNLPHEYRFLDPYVRSLTAVPRAAIVQHATQHFELLTTLSSYTLDACRAQQHYPGLITFWGGVFTESINGMLDVSKSGRKSVQVDKDIEVLQQVGPVLGEALLLRKAPGAQIAAYMATSVLASKANLSDAALNAFMEQLVQGWTEETVRPGLVCLSILAQQRSTKQLSRKVAKAVLKVSNLSILLIETSKQRRIDKLANGLVLALTGRLAKKAAVRGLPIIKAIILGNILQEKQLAFAFKSLLDVANAITDEVDPLGSARKELGATLVILSQASAEAGGDIVRKVIEEVDFDIEDLEMKLDASIRPKLLESRKTDEDTEMTNGVEDPSSAGHEDLDAAIARLSTLSRPKSCLAKNSDDVFEQICQVLLVTVAHNKSELDKLDAIPLLGRADAVSNNFYLSFCIRVWSGPYPALARVTALNLAAQRLSQDDCQGFDFQALLPYCISAMADPAKKVRQAAATLLYKLKSLAPHHNAATDAKHRWGSSALYNKQDGLKWLSPSERSSLLGVVTESLDEAVLHEDHLSSVLRTVLDKSGNKSESGEEHIRISHGVRLALLTFLASHTVLSPVLVVRLRLLKFLNEIRGVSGTTRTDLLLPLLHWWASLSSAEANSLSEKESLIEDDIDAASVDIVVPNDKAGLECFFNIIKGPQVQTRRNLVRHVFTRIRKMWPVMKEEHRFPTALFMLELVQKSSPTDDELDFAAEEAADMLHNVALSTRILKHFLESLQHEVKFSTAAPPSKKRRLSTDEHHQPIHTVEDTEELKAILNRTTFVLQIIQGANPAEHPELLQPLFTVLSDLQTLRTFVGSELGYLQNLVLSCLLIIMPVYQNNKNLKIDTSVGHGDILINCIHKSTSPAVQNAALLLVASLAKTAPDVVLHSVMPIFTLMGNSVLRQSDDYSAHVVNQTIKEVIPPLIETFRKGKRNIVAAASDLLVSFVIAYEHIPSHRKRELFVTLTENLGPRDFLFAILAMFADRYGTAESTCAFLIDLLSTFPVEVQLQSLIQFVALTGDIFKPKPGLSATLLGKPEDGSSSEQSDLQRSALKELTLLPQLLANRRLRDEIGQLDEAVDDMESAKIRELYVELLEDILTLADTVRPQPNGENAQRGAALHARCGDAVAQLLNLQSIGEFIKAVETLLDRPNISVRQKVLRALEVRVDREKQSSLPARTALLSFLPQLTAVVRDSSDIAYKHTAVICVDKIAEKYGRRDLEAVTAAAEAIASDACLGQSDQRLCIISLLCLTSLVEVLQDAMVPILPVAIPRTLGYLQELLKPANSDAVDTELHNAAYSFMMALAQHLPYMLTGSYLDRLFVQSFASAEASLDTDSSTSRLHCLQVLAHQVDPKVIFEVLRRNWSNAIKTGPLATAEYIQILTASIHTHKKAAIVKSLPALAATFQNAFDLRREVRMDDKLAAVYEGDGTKEATSGENNGARLAVIEAAVNAAAIQMIVKLNDNSFRPVFVEWLRWCDNDLPKLDHVGRCLRQQSVYGFLLVFFTRLKSAVTTYAAYLIDGAVDALQHHTRLATSADNRLLWARVLQTLTACFSYDNDETSFWQVPAHFDAIMPVLVEQFGKARDLDRVKAADGDNISIVGQLIPCVAQLAKAAHAADHQKALNTALLRRTKAAGGASYVAERLAIVQCQGALAEALGEEWLSLLPEMLPYVSELQNDDNDAVDRETQRWISKIEGILGVDLGAMLQ